MRIKFVVYKELEGDTERRSVIPLSFVYPLQRGEYSEYKIARKPFCLIFVHLFILIESVTIDDTSFILYLPKINMCGLKFLDEGLDEKFFI